MRPSKTLKLITWSIKGLLFGCPKGVPNIWVNSSFSSLRCGSLSNAASNDRTGRDPFKQFPVKRNSSIVCTFCTKNLQDGPKGVADAHRYKSFRFRNSKKSAVLQLFISAISLIAVSSRFVSSLTSRLWWGSNDRRSPIKWRYDATAPREHSIRHRCLFTYFIGYFLFSLLSDADALSLGPESSPRFFFFFPPNVLRLAAAPFWYVVFPMAIGRSALAL